MKPNYRYPKSIAGIFLSSLFLLQAGANTLLFRDNFDTADTGNLDAAPLTGRLTGTLANTVFPRSAKILQTIAGNQLSLVRVNGGVTGRVRFHNAGGWHNWASGTDGAAILADGGMRVEFDWTPPGITSGDWIGFNIGHNAQAAGEPDLRVINAGTDYGIIFRDNGQGSRFDGGAGIGNTTPYTPLAAARHVVIDFGFTSFDDGTTVSTTTKVDGFQVASDSFTWDGNAGVIHMELECYQTGERIDNFTVSTLPPEFLVSVDPTSFVSGADLGDLVGILSGSTLSGGQEASTFTFVAGTGDTHNSRFQINGDQLEAGGYDFTQDPGGTLYFIRVLGTGTVSGGSQETELILTLIKDDDEDTLLDDWELQFRDNLMDLDGLGFGPGPGAGTGDFDGDGITDLDEYNYSQGAYPGISPVSRDSDGDLLDDDEELVGADLRPTTHPGRADTDFDGLSDLVESNSGTFGDASDSGSDPTVPDTDLDGSRDGFEVAKGSDPVDNASRPTLPTGFALVPLTDDASTGLSTSKTYTHLVSSAQAASVNGVNFEEVSPFISPLNFAWAEVGAGNRDQIVNNNNNWNPANGGVTGPGIANLLDSFVYTTGGSPGQYQTYTLSGLTPGETYQVRLYIRAWNKTGGSGRPIDLTFTHGATVEVPFGGLKEDRPGTVLNNGNDDSAYYLSYTYVAETTQLEIKAEVHASSVDTPQSASGHFHLYALSNEVVPPPGGDLVVTSVARNGAGDIVIDFTGAASTTYDVTKSPDLTTPFGPLTSPLTATTDPGGVGQAVVPATEASEPSEFYRVEDQ